MHGIITDGGQAANIVPERAAATYYLRAVDMAEPRGPAGRGYGPASTALRSPPARRSRCAGRPRVRPRVAEPGLVAAFGAACDGDRPPVHPDPAGPELGGSTDFGNVSQLVPALHADLAVHSWPAVNHQHEFAAHCVTPAGDRTLLEGAAAMALTALAVAADRSVIDTG